MRCTDLSQLEVHPIMRANRHDLARGLRAQEDTRRPVRPESEPSPTTSIAILICTRERSRRLEECLRSLSALRIPANIDATVIVVENDEQPTCQGLVLKLATSMPHWQIRYSHEPRLGIPIARNHALRIALQIRADWIAFIDDDETVTAGWLEAMLSASRACDADVLQGPVDYIYPADAPAWLERKELPVRPLGTRLRTAYTNNVMMKARLACSEGLGLAFDERLRFTGGSDADYFCRAADRGAVIRWVGDAVVREVVTPERLTMAWQARRALRVAANASSLHSRRFGHLRAIGRYGPKSLGRIFGGLAHTAVAAPLLVVKRSAAERAFFKGLKQAASGIGGIGAFLNFRPQPYRRVDGDAPRTNGGKVGAEPSFTRFEMAMPPVGTTSVQVTRATGMGPMRCSGD